MKDDVTRSILQGYRRAGIEIAPASFEIARMPPMSVQAAGRGDAAAAPATPD